MEGLESCEVYRSEIEQLEMVAKDLHHDKCVHGEMFAAREEHANTNTTQTQCPLKDRVSNRFSWRNAKTQ